MTNEEVGRAETRVVYLEEALLAVGPEWPDDQTFDDWLAKLKLLRTKVDEQFESAHNDWERQKEALPADHLNADDLIDAGELGRLLEVAFFNLFMSHFERALVDRYYTLRTKIENTQADDAVVFSKAINYFVRHLGAGAADFKRLRLLSSLRNRLLHDGAKWTKEVEQQLSPLIEAGEIYRSLIDDVGLRAGFVDRAVMELKSAFVSISQAVREYSS